ncbi:MAG: hypothetical protein ACFFE8_11340 [Candidatus Heimdallarchaeota archaeon]
MRNRRRVSVFGFFVILLAVLGLVFPTVIGVTDSTQIFAVAYVESDQTTHLLLRYRLTTVSDSSLGIYHAYKSSGGIWSQPQEMDLNGRWFLSLVSNNDSLRLYTTEEIFYRFPAKAPSMMGDYRYGEILYEHIYDPLTAEWMVESIFETDQIMGELENESSSSSFSGVDLFDNDVLFVRWEERFTGTAYITKLDGSSNSSRTYILQNNSVKAIIPQKNRLDQYFIYTRDYSVTDNYTRYILFSNDTMTGPEEVPINSQDFLFYSIVNNFFFGMEYIDSPTSWKTYDLSMNNISMSVYPYDHESYTFGTYRISPFDLTGWDDESLLFATIQVPRIEFWLFGTNDAEMILLGNATMDIPGAEQMNLASINVINDAGILTFYWTFESIPGFSDSYDVEYNSYNVEYNSHNSTASEIRAMRNYLDFSLQRNQLFVRTWVNQFILLAGLACTGWLLVWSVSGKRTDIEVREDRKNDGKKSLTYFGMPFFLLYSYFRPRKNRRVEEPVNKNNIDI